MTKGKLTATGVAVVLTVLYLFSGNKPVNTGTSVVLSPQPPSTTVNGASKTKEILHITPPSDRLVRIDDVIGGATQDVAATILRLGQSPEPLYVELYSPGGSVLDGAMIISAIEAAKGPVYTICNTLCASMAALIFEHGTKRYMVDRSFVMFHPASGGSEGEVDKMVSRLLSIQRYIGKMEAYVAQRAGLTFEQYKQKSGIEMWIDSEDAIGTGFADNIVSVILPEEHKMFLFGNNLSTQPNTSYLPGVVIDPMVTKFNFNWILK